MTPVSLLTSGLLDLLAADATTLDKAGGSENYLSLIIADFTPSRDLAVGGLTLATFTGSASLAAASGAQQVGYDPTVGQWFIQIIPPAGGWYFEASVAPGTTQTVYGAALTNHAKTTLYGTVRLPSPVPIAQVGDSVALPYVRFYESDLLTPAA